MKNKPIPVLCDSCANRSICKLREDVERATAEYAKTLYSAVTIGDGSVAYFTNTPITCSRRDPVRMTR